MLGLAILLAIGIGAGYLWFNRHSAHGPGERTDSGADTVYLPDASLYHQGQAWRLPHLRDDPCTDSERWN